MGIESLVKSLLGKHEPAIELPKPYSISTLTQALDQPFLLNSELKDTARMITRNSYSNEKKAKALFEWMQENIQYHIDRKRMVRNSIETFYEKKGKCYDQSVLFVSLARSLGMHAKFVKVRKDTYGKRVDHACVGVATDRALFVDNTYHLFDVEHKKYEIVDDTFPIYIYRGWRTGNSLKLGNYFISFEKK